MHGQWSFTSAVFKMESKLILGCTFEISWKSDASRKEMLVVYAKGAKGYESLPETFQLCINKGLLGQRK